MGMPVTVHVVDDKVRDEAIDAAFDDMPALFADEKACHRSPTPERYFVDTSGDLDLCAQSLAWRTGLRIARPLSLRRFYTHGLRRSAMFLLHDLAMRSTNASKAIHT